MNENEQQNQVHPIAPKVGHILFWGSILFVCYGTTANGFGASTLGEYLFVGGFLTLIFVWPMWILAEMLQRKVYYSTEKVVASQLLGKPISMNLCEITTIQFHSGRIGYRAIRLILNKQKINVSTTQKGFWAFARFIRDHELAQEKISYGFLHNGQHFWFYEKDFLDKNRQLEEPNDFP